MQDYERVKFIFSGLEKFIIMDLNSKIALDDLKFTFTNILKIDIFAKKLQFSIQKGLKQYELDSQQCLKGQNEMKSLIQNNQDKKQLDIVVKFIEEGA